MTPPPLFRPRVLVALTTAVLLSAPSAAAEAVSAPSSQMSAQVSGLADGRHGPSGDTSRQAARFQGQLAKAGYVSQSGENAVFELNERYCSGVTFSALWPNPQSPYIVTRLPEVPGQAPNTNPPVTWRIRQDEAVVMIGTTPPPEEYFSFDLTMMRGSLHDGPLLWTSVGDPINLRTVHTTGRTPFDRPFALVMTGNRRTQDEVNQMLAASGLRGAINDMTIPPAMFRLGLGADSDQFLFGMRTIVPQPGYEKALDDYRAMPPLQVFRVRPQNNSGDETQPVYQPDPLPVPKLRVSGTGKTELNLNPTLQLLRQRIIDAHPGYDVRDEVVERGFEEGYPALQSNLITAPPVTGSDALSYDADDPITRNFNLPDGSFIVAYGTNHVATGQAAYSSISVNAGTTEAVALEVKDNTNLFGSARDFISDKPNADDFYAWTFSCAGGDGPSGAHVTTLPSTSSDFCAQYGADRPVDLSAIRVGARAYMQPTTLSRPALSSLLMDRVLIFTPKK